MKKRVVFEHFGLLNSLLILILIFSFLHPQFATDKNMMLILKHSAIEMIAAIGITIVILAGSIDLSVGSLLALVGITTVWSLNSTGSVLVGVAAGLGVGVVVGLVNGLIVTVVRIKPLIATLATMVIFRGLTHVVTKSQSIQCEVNSFKDLGSSVIVGIPIPVLITLVVFAIFYFLLHKTVFGRTIYAVGGNERAAHLAGLPVMRTRLLVFVLCSLLAALSGVILSSYLASGQPTTGSGFELTVIAAVILGGASLEGGQGSLIGTIIGVLILAVLFNGMVLLEISSFYQDIMRGAVILVAVFIDTHRRSK